MMNCFKQNKITMLNVWATWCGPCKGELEGLGDMNRRYAGKGVAVVGLCTDGDEKLEDCKKLLADNNVDYLNLLPFEGFQEVIPIPCYPVSYYVDRSRIRFTSDLLFCLQQLTVIPWSEASYSCYTN